MRRTWNHRIAKLIDVPEQVKKFYGLSPACSVAKCDNSPAYCIEYDYVTGKRGRVSYVVRFYCQKHAESFCRKHNIDITTAPEMPWSEHYCPKRNQKFAIGGK